MFRLLVIGVLSKESFLNNTLSHHSIGYLHETCYVCTLHIVDIDISLLAILHALLMDIRHDVVEFLINFCLAPTQTHRVLGHFKTRSGNTTCIDSLTRSKELMGSNELFCCFCCATHVRYLSYAEWLVGQNLVGIGSIEFVLSSTRQINVSLALPRLLVCVEFRTCKLFGIR